MNQILYSENLNNNQNNGKKKSKKNKQKNKNNYEKGTKQLEITSIVKFFAVIIVLFGICVIGVVSFSWYKNTKENNANATKPTINIASENDKLLLTVSHDKAIKEVSYQWVGQDAVKIDADNHMYVEETIDIPEGTNTLTIVATDVNNQTTSYNEQYSGANKPRISLSVVDYNIKATISSEKEVKYIMYKWDEEEEKKVDVNNVYFEQIIEIPQGEHELTIMAVDEDNASTTKKQKVRGVTKPTVTITTDGTNLIVHAEDEGKLEKVVVTFNGEEKTLQVNDKQFEYSVPIVDGENNIEATAYNENGISSTYRAKCKK